MKPHRTITQCIPISDLAIEFQRLPTRIARRAVLMSPTAFAFYRSVSRGVQAAVLCLRGREAFIIQVARRENIRRRLHCGCRWARFSYRDAEGF